VAGDRVVAKLREAERALQFVTTIHQAKVVADVAAAQELFAHRQRLGVEIENYAYSIKTYALAKLGELLAVMPKATGGTHGGRPTKLGTKREPSYSAPSTLADYHLDKKTSAVAQQLAALPTVTRDAIAAREMSLSQAQREVKAKEIAKRVALPDAKYRVVYADPPWSYNDKADAGAVQSGGAEQHYPSMSIADLCALPISSLCEPDAVLFLWVTSPLLFECQPVIKAWGFSYRASFVWDKVKHNMGHYNSVRHEFLLVCVRGSCQPDQVTLFDSVQVVERTAHSVKPQEFRVIIDTLYPLGKRLELFARGASPSGWDAWGNEAQ
jgi:N6-adenosine-specific RNA methylase IME4